MSSGIRSLCMAVLTSLLVVPSHGTDTDTSGVTADSDGNGIQDRYEADLAAKFVPAMVLDSRDNVSPESVSFIGAHTKDSLWVTLFTVDGSLALNKPLADVNPRDWDPPLINGTIAGASIDSTGDFLQPEESCEISGETR